VSQSFLVDPKMDFSWFGRKADGGFTHVSHVLRHESGSYPTSIAHVLAAWHSTELAEYSAGEKPATITLSFVNRPSSGGTDLMDEFKTNLRFNKPEFHERGGMEEWSSSPSGHVISE